MVEYSELGFDPIKLSYEQEKLGLEYADSDTAFEILKLTEKTLISELTRKYMGVDYKNITELNSYIHTDERFREFEKHFSNILKKRNRNKVRYETFKAFRDDLRTKTVTERELAKHL